MIVYLAKKTFLVIFVFTCLIFLLLEFVLRIESSTLRVVLPAFFSVILSPRRKKINTQTGEKTQITWFFLKEPIFLDK